MSSKVIHSESRYTGDDIKTRIAELEAFIPKLSSRLIKKSKFMVVSNSFVPELDAGWSDYNLFDSLKVLIKSIRIQWRRGG